MELPALLSGSFFAGGSRLLILAIYNYTQNTYPVTYNLLYVHVLQCIIKKVLACFSLIHFAWRRKLGKRLYTCTSTCDRALCCPSTWYMSVVYVRVDTHVRVQKIMHVSTCIRMSIHSLSIWLCVRIAMYMCTYACVHVCAYTPPSSYICISTCRDTHVTMYVHARVHVQSCVCVCTHPSSWLPCALSRIALSRLSSCPCPASWERFWSGFLNLCCRRRVEGRAIRGVVLCLLWVEPFYECVSSHDSLVQVH